MLLRRLTPMGTFNQLRREVNRAFGDFMPDFDLGLRSAPAFPPVNIWEDGERFMLEAEVPGLKMENLDVQVLASEITIKGRRVREPRENLTFHRQERGAGEFTRTVALPADIDVDRVEATLRDGVLTITLPKAATAKARKITVKPQDEQGFGSQQSLE